MKRNFLSYVNVAMLAILMILYFALRQADTVGLWAGILALAVCAALAAALWTLELIREQVKYEAHHGLYWMDLAMGAVAMFALVMMMAIAAANIGPACSLPR
jgi:hypothetical protein